LRAKIDVVKSSAALWDRSGRRWAKGKFSPASEKLAAQSL